MRVIKYTKVILKSKLVLNVLIKAFWYIKHLFPSVKQRNKERSISIWPLKKGFLLVVRQVSVFMIL